MAVYKRGKICWYNFNWNGEPIRESTKQTNKRVDGLNRGGVAQHRA